MSLAGSVSGGDLLRFVPQMQPYILCTVTFTLRDANKQGVARLRLYGPNEDNTYFGWLEPVTAPESVNCASAASYGEGVASVTLNRQP